MGVDLNVGWDSAPSPAAAGSPTIGVVIDLPEPHATVVRRWRGRVGDPQAELIPPHVTLLPPTPVRARLLPAVTSHLAAAAATVAPFAMHLSGTGTFRPLSRVVFVEVAAGIAQCEVLEAAIRADVLDRPREFPFHPHVTVAHDVDDAALDAAYEGLGDFVARFRVDRFVLYLRGADGRWQAEREFLLTGTP
jgi:2'-5' RNA ligase